MASRSLNVFTMADRFYFSRVEKIKTLKVRGSVRLHCRQWSVKLLAWNVAHVHHWLVPAEPIRVTRRLFCRPCFHGATAAHQGHRPLYTCSRGLVTLTITCGCAEKPLLVPRSPQGQRLYSGLAALRQIAAFIHSIVGGVGTTGPPARTGPLMRWRQQNVVKRVCPCGSPT